MYGLRSYLLWISWQVKTNYLYKWGGRKEDKPYGTCEFSKLYKIVEVDIKKQI